MKVTSVDSSGQTVLAGPGSMFILFALPWYVLRQQSSGLGTTQPESRLLCCSWVDYQE